MEYKADKSSCILQSTLFTCVNIVHIGRSNNIRECFTTYFHQMNSASFLLQHLRLVHTRAFRQHESPLPSQALAASVVGHSCQIEQKKKMHLYMHL